MTSRNPLKRRLSQLDNSQHLATDCSDSGTPTTSRDLRHPPSKSHDISGYGDEVLENYFMRSVTNETQYNGQLDSSLACFTVGRPSLQINEEDIIQETPNHEQAALVKDHVPAEPIHKTGPSTTTPFPTRCLPSTSTGGTHTNVSRVGQDHARKSASRTTHSNLGTNARMFYPRTSISPQLSTAGQLDCMPWVGRGPEDRMTEKAIKEGYFEKSPVSNELNSARPSFWAQLKSGVGLTCLSALYTDVLSQKQQLGRVDGLSTFKPPPRVTLTDTKREAWLRDLANPALPLKRLSRTIPHGLRGRVLLEQCLLKTIPIDRAVWLAKCVGANELRAFRRKGVTGAAMAGNEENWSLEWTLAVEAFSVECIDSTEEQGRKERIKYAFGITASLFTSNLLVKDHFLSWLLTQLEQCALHAFMIWLTFASSYQRSILQDISQGRHLVRVLVTRIAQIDQLPQGPPVLTMLRRAQGLLCNLCLSSPWCVMFPEQHNRYKLVLGGLSSELAEDKTARRIRQLIDRNNRLAVATGSLRTSESPIASTVVIYLDSIVPQEMQTLSSRCLQLAKNTEEAVLELIIWSSTIYRIGAERIYVAIQILTAWFHEGVNITSCILSGLPHLDSAPHLRTRTVGRIVAELSRQGVFDLSIALRRFIVTGSIRRNPPANEISCTQRVLLDMPRYLLTPTLNNIRSMLLRSAGISLDTVVDGLEKLSLLYESGLERVHAKDTAVSKPNQAIDVRTLLAQASWGGVLELTARLIQTYENLPMTASERDMGSSMRARMAISLLKVLDDLGEYTTFLQFALKVLTLEDMDVVACVVSIVRFRVPIILALSAGASLPLRILDTYCICRATSPPSRVIVQALLDIFTHLQVQGRIQEYLKHEIVLWDQTFTVMACSPLSDFQTEGAQPCASLLDDLEGVVSQVQVLEADTIDRVLVMLSARLAELKEFSCLDNAALRVLFQRVHICNGNHLFLQWLANQLGRSENQSCVRAISVLISCGGISTEIFSAAGEKAYETAVHADAANAAQAATMILGVMVDIVTNDVVVESKSIKPFFPAVEFGRYVNRVLAGSLALRNTDSTELPAILSTSSFSSAFANMLSTNAVDVEHGLDVDNLLQNGNALIILRKLLSALLNPTSNGLRKDSQTDVARAAALQDEELLNRIFINVDEICLPIYSLALKILVHHGHGSATDEIEPQLHITSTVKLAMNKSGRCWLQLLPMLSNDMLSEIAHSTEDNLLSQNSTADRSIQLDVLRITAKHLSETTGRQMCQTIAEKLAAIVHDDEDQSKSTEHVRTLIELALVHCHTLLTSPEAQSMRVEILSILPQILTSQHLSLSTATLELVFDAAAYLVTGLTTAMKDYIQISLGSLSNHPRIRFLFGFRERPNGWLYATTETSFTLQDGEPTPPESRSHLQPFKTQQWEMLAHSTPNSGVNNAALSLHLFDARQV